MKKFIILMVTCFLMVVPAFAETNLSTAQLNKQGWEYLKQNDYQKALSSFRSIFLTAKTQQDYEYVMYGFLEVINNETLPTELRISLCDLLLDKPFTSKLTDPKLINLSTAMMFKSINIIAKADENDAYFKEKLHKEKSTVLQEEENIYTEAVEQYKGSFNSILYFACYEYAIGNKFMGMRLFEYIGNAKLQRPEIAKYEGDTEDLTDLINLVMKLCK